MAARLKDIAQKLGVSVMTVSIALRGAPGVSAAMRARVVKVATELGYQPDRAARALVTGRSHAIGLVVPDLVHPFFARIARGLAGILRSRDYGLVIATSDEDGDIEARAVDVMLAQRVDALIIAPVQTGPGSAMRVQNATVPVVLIDRQLPRGQFPFVGNDDHAIGLLATEHLLSQGCRRVAHIEGPATSPGAGRLAGYKAALKRARLPATASLVVQAQSVDVGGLEAGFVAMRKLLQQKPRPDGVFCFNDLVAFGAMRAVFEAGLRIPEDVAMIGCGNFDASDLLRVPLSSIDQGCETIGERAAQRALELLDTKSKARTEAILVAPELVVRASSTRKQGK